MLPVHRLVALTVLGATAIGAPALLVLAPSQPAAAASALPMAMVWAWERPEDLRSINPRKIGVAFLARTVTLDANRVIVRPRLQPLTVPPGTRLVAVVRIETGRGQTGWTDAQRATVARAVAGAWRPGVDGLQIDFDARASERAIYRLLLDDVRAAVPATVPLSITALASWCMDDHWMDGLPVTEAVPMLFRMGPDDDAVTRRLEGGADFSKAICRHSVGRSTDERSPSLRPARRTYVFHPKSWSADALRTVAEEAGR